MQTWGDVGDVGDVEEQVQTWGAGKSRVSSSTPSAGHTRHRPRPPSSSSPWPSRGAAIGHFQDRPVEAREFGSVGLLTLEESIGPALVTRSARYAIPPRRVRCRAWRCDGPAAASA